MISRSAEDERGAEGGEALILTLTLTLTLTLALVALAKAADARELLAVVGNYGMVIDVQQWQ